MIKLKLNNKAYELPERLTTDQWMKIVRLDIEDRTLWPHIVATAFGAPLRAVQAAPEEALELGLGFIYELLSRTRECSKKDYNKFTFGQFIDLDVWLVDGHDKWLHKIAETCGPTQWADEALWLANDVSRWRTHVYKQYSELFGLETREEFLDKFEDEPAINRGAEHARSWMQVLYSLSNDNVLNIDPITDLPIKQALNFMAIRKEIRQRELEEMKQKQRKLKLA